MTDAVGNVNVGPGAAVTAYTTNVELLAATGSGYNQDGVTLKVGQGTLATGTPIVYDSASTQYVAAATNATAIDGFLRDQVDTGVVGDIPKLGNRVFKGVLKYSVIKAANGGTDLAAGALAALFARVDTRRDYFIF